VSDVWTRAIERFVLSLSDQQLVTGLSVLLLGYIGLPASQGQINVLDFTNAVYLAWFSGVTHLITLYVLREYFRNPAHSVLRAIRLTTMLVFGLFLIVSLAFTTQPGFGALNCPAKCVFQDPPAPGFNLSLAIGPTPVTSQAAAQGTDSQRTSAMRVYVAFLAIGYIMAMAPMFFRTFLAIDLFSVLMNIILFMIALMEFMIMRGFSQGLSGNEAESIWSFGQILAVLLFLVPVLQGLEIVYGTSESFRRTKLCEQKNMESSGKTIRSVGRRVRTVRRRRTMTKPLKPHRCCSLNRTRSVIPTLNLTQTTPLNPTQTTPPNPRK
jgi:hypothetical protein